MLKEVGKVNRSYGSAPALRLLLKFPFRAGPTLSFARQPLHLLPLSEDRRLMRGRSATNVGGDIWAEVLM